MSRIEIQEAILAFLAKYPREEFRSKELARRLGYRDGQAYEDFREALAGLKDEKRVLRVSGKQYRHLHIPTVLSGTMRMTRQGFGFVVPDDGSDDIFVAARDANHATHGDKVEVALFLPKAGKRKEGDRAEGEVTRILARGRTEVVGTLERVRKTLFVVPDDIRIAPSIGIDPEDLNGARPGQKVVVAIESWGDEHFHPEGRIVEVLGVAGQVTAEIRSVVREFGLPTGFPSAVNAEAAAFPERIPDQALAQRIDLRDDRCVTIDPSDAKDFDDALSLERLTNGNYRLGVHIADVSYYVREGSELDTEAMARGTSVYLPNAVVPMLPERLSADLCSLRPDVDRLALSAIMEITPKGVVKSFTAGETVIRSKRRFTYEEVQAILDGEKSKQGREDGGIVQMVLDLHGLASTLTAKRMKEGSVDFDSPEAVFTFDAEGKPSSIRRKPRLASHRLVEECMLLANTMVAKHFGVSKKEEHLRPFIFRVHDAPDPARIAELALFVSTFGFKLHVDGTVRSKDLQKLLDKVRGSEVENLINEVAIRSMAKAEYSVKNIGHFGLAFDTYTHFTSPIRRYPDLIVHRLIKEYVSGMSYERSLELTRAFPDIAKHASERERNAMEAERAATKVMQVEYMKRHLGDVFPAVVSGVTRFGLFVEINDLLVEGMVHVRDLDDDYYEFDEKAYSLTGRRHGKRYRLGDAIEVRVVNVNPEERQIDFRIQQGTVKGSGTSHSGRGKRSR